MFTWPQVIEQCRDEAQFPSGAFPTDSQWMNYISKALQTVWLFVHRWAPRALPRGTYIFSTIAGQHTYTLPQDFAAVLAHPEWRETATLAREVILPTYPVHPLIYVERKSYYGGTSRTQYEIWRHESLPDRYKIALYPYPQDEIPNTVGANRVQLDYARRPLAQFFGSTNSVTATTLTLGAPHSTFGQVIRVPDYYKGTQMFVYGATTNAFQFVTVSAFSPALNHFTFTTSWPIGTPTGAVSYMTAPIVVELWQKCIVSQACLYALRKDENSTGMLAPIQAQLVADYADLQYYLETQYPTGPRVPVSLDDLS